MPTLSPLLASLALLAATPPAERHPFGVDDLLALPRVGAPAVSPDGKLVAFTLGRAAADESGIESSLWVVATDGGAPRRLTSAPGEKVSTPRFSPDGKRLAFTAARGGAPQAWVLALAGGEAAQVTRLPAGAGDLLWTADGQALLVATDVDPACGSGDACAARAAPEPGAPRLATRLLFRHWNAWRERVRTHVLRVPLAGGAPEDLTPGDRDVPPYQRGDAGDLALSADGGTLLYARITDPVEAISTNADLYAVPLQGGPARRLTEGPGWDGSPRPSPSGKQLAWRSQARSGYEADRFRLLVGGPAGEEPRDLTAGVDLSVDEVVWTSERRLVFTADEGGLANLYEVDAAAGGVRRLLGGANLHALSASRDGRTLAALVDGFLRPPEVAVVQGGKVKVLTRFGDEVMARVALPSFRPLGAKSRDGAEVHGWLMTPPGHRAGERHPGVVLVHGGPQGAWKDAWSFRWNPLLYAARGWTVVLPNPRGSTGFGQAYQDAVRMSWGGAPFDDVMALTDAALAGGEADGARLCAAGASYGGYMVNWMNGHTDRFRCLVAHAGDFDLEAAYYDTEELWFPEWELGRPWEDRTAYERWSPHRFVQRWRTPTLVTHGELDYRVTVTQALSTYTALQRLGVESRLLVFPDEGHWILRPKNARVFHDVVLSWIADHLGRSPAPAARPDNP
ncbi:alpha/beta hydrolase family protein [Anaeromyxobacter diazotrophicus]|uniref:Prolyl oligopeptidase n=1 Tax=Anaeromyxobacter diazotrophicus TaxID=2590199 RepID=A0A7I9VQH6_9BACT|nr:S9 family peptidase [Anaeromyxobacter diazotrophicus]GEJ58664.1 prolyl oligopeptidase [Anaeromyxobacter diazotrophicus]